MRNVLTPEKAQCFASFFVLKRFSIVKNNLVIYFLKKHNTYSLEDLFIEIS